jgi:hypothetical protein
VNTPRSLAAITGASSGIGEVFSRKLAERGYELLLVARRRDKLATLAQELSQKHGVHAEAIEADLASEAGLAHVEQRLKSSHNLEFLVNNAGFGTTSLFHESDFATQERMHRLHVTATLRLCHAALPNMLAQNRGRIVNVSSVASFVQSPYNVSYCATKAWVNSFSEGLYLEMRAAKADVRVQALCPGYTHTEFHEVMGVGRSFASKSWWMSAEAVVDASLAGLERNKLFVIPGLRYKLIVALLKILPKSILHANIARSPSVKRAAQKR